MPWSSVSWWQDRVAAQSSPLIPRDATITGVSAEAPPHRQANTTLHRVSVAYTRPSGGAEGGRAALVVKEVALDRSRFRDDEHYARTWASYRAEAGFYLALAPRFRGGGAAAAGVPQAFSVDEIGEGRLTIAMEDLGATNQAPLLSLPQARGALGLLAGFHARMCGAAAGSAAESAGLWRRGGYWSLEKRRADLPRIPGAWALTLEAFAPVLPAVAAAPAMATLGRDLASRADELDAGLQALSAPGTGLFTLLHGDFKAANLFFPPGDGSAACVDFQWSGPGCGAVDVAYLLWSSVHPDVLLTHEQELLSHYHASLVAALPEGVGPGGAPLAVPEWGDFLAAYDLAVVDYVRFLAGAMWPGMTPAKCAATWGKGNYGATRRHAGQLLRVAARAADLLDAVPAGSGVETWRRAAEERAGREGACEAMVTGAWGEMYPPRQGGAGYIVEFAAASAHLAERAGEVIRGYMALLERGELGVNDKAGQVRAAGTPEGQATDPQTMADLEAERVICGGLAAAFPGLQLLGEEMFETGAESKARRSGEDPSAVLAGLLGSETATAVWDALVGTGWHACLPRERRAAALEDVCCWIDPLDGTKEFLYGNPPGVTVLIGMAHQGRAAAGVVHQPFYERGGKRVGRTFVGVPGAGAFVRVGREGPYERVEAGAEGWAAQGLTRAGEVRVATTRSHMTDAVREAALKVQPDASKVERIGGAGSKAMLLLDGEVSHYVFASKGTKRWDTLGPEAVLRAAGGFLVAADNAEPYSYELPAFDDVKDIPGDRVYNTRGLVAGMSPAAFDIVREAFGGQWQGKRMPAE